MAPIAPALDTDATLRFFYENDPLAQYPTRAVENLANELAEKVVASQDQLRAIYLHHADLIHKRWPKKLLKHRRELLLSAWPNMAECHRPESFGKDSYQICVRFVGVPPEEHVWPYINLEDLQDKKSLLLLLNSRSRYPPHMFAMTEQTFMPLGKVFDTRAPLQKMLLNGRNNYGSIVSFATEAKATDFEDTGKGLSPGAGLQVLNVQDRLLTFLLKCCEALLPDQELQTLVIPDGVIIPEISSMLNSDGMETKFADVAAKAPYRVHNTLNLSRLYYLTSAMAKASQDSVWLLREDPGYFAEAYQNTVDHDLSQVSDRKGKKHSATGKPDFVSSMLHELVARSHYMLVFWEELAKHIKKIEELFRVYPDGINVESLKPTELFETMQSVHLLLESMKHWVVAELRQFVASPSLRDQFIRSTSQNNLQQVTESDTFEDDPVKEQLCLLLWNICGGLNTEETNIFPDIHFRLDLLETFFQKNKGSRDMISSSTEQAITKLSVLAECFHHLVLQPWDLKVCAELLVNGKELVDRLSNPFRAWNQIFAAAMNTGFIPSPALGDPSDGKFKYPSHESKSKKKTVDALCAAEANLDIFWSQVDHSLRRLSGEYEEGTLQRLLEEGGEMRRTKPWSEGRQLKKSQATLSKDFYISQPVSQIFHDTSSDVTGKFDKFSISEKAKEKTRGTAAITEAPAAAEPEHDPSSAPSPQFKVNKASYRVFKALFHIPFDNDPPGEVRWNAFVNALISLGFSAEQLHGSAWQFTPSADLGLDRGISFHEPHPDDKMPLTMVRRLGARLTRAYGWDGSMFQER